MISKGTDQLGQNEVKTPLVFLDRDGTISSDEYGYINNPDDYCLYPYTTQALRLIRASGYKIVVVTNQSGIARGYFTEEQLASVHAKLISLVEADDAKIDHIYYSPYFKDGVVAPFNVEHLDRKPGLGMFHQAQKDFNLCLAASWMIGDRYSDIKFGHNAGLKTILLLTGNGRNEFYNEMPQWDIRPDFVADNLLTAAKLLHTHYFRN